MKWFGRRYGAPYEEGPHVPTPVGEACGWCDEAIVSGDDGMMIPTLGERALYPGRVEVPYHYECQLRSIIGGLNHLKGRCTCCGGDQPPDPPNMTRREAAAAAVKAWQERKKAP